MITDDIHVCVGCEENACLYLLGEMILMCLYWIAFFGWSLNEHLRFRLIIDYCVGIL